LELPILVKRPWKINVGKSQRDGTHAFRKVDMCEWQMVISRHE
jgi:hypothetical protein